MCSCGFFLWFYCEQERLKEIPTSTATSSGEQFYQGPQDHLRALPGSEFDHAFSHPNAQVCYCCLVGGADSCRNYVAILQVNGNCCCCCQGSEFLRGFRAADQNGLADAWDEIQRPQVAPPPQQLDHMGPQLQPTLDGKLHLLRSKLIAQFCLEHQLKERHISYQRFYLRFEVTCFQNMHIEGKA